MTKEAESMKKAVQVFEFGDKGTSIQVRSLIDKESNPWFVAKDIAVALGYADFDQAVRKNCRSQKEVKNIPVCETGISKEVRDGSIMIPESDVFRLILRSKLESAERFQDWVVEEVLPAIRKYGYYISVSSQPHMLPENYDYFPVEALAAAAEISIVDFNKKLQSYELQEAAVNANGMMVFKLTKKGKKFGIPQQAYEEGGIKMPPRILWKSSIFNVMAFGFKTGSRDRLYANNNQCSLT
jgi:prophage antirepressor-like protein